MLFKGKTAMIFKLCNLCDGINPKGVRKCGRCGEHTSFRLPTAEQIAARARRNEAVESILNSLMAA